MVVDASVWVSALVPQDVHHATSGRWLSDRLAAGETLIIPILALAEVAGAIARRTGAPELGQQAADQIARVPGSRLVALDLDLGTEAARIAASRQLRGADAIYVATARLLNATLVTWDEELLSRAAGLVQVVHP